MKTTATELNIRRAADRGHADHGWLNSHHTFSFADYYDPAHMGFRSLRVINDDRVAPGQGFGMHPHRDMEIFSYVLDGTLEHKDSMGNGRQLTTGQIQLMSAGRDITHSEFNPSPRQSLHFLQIWIQPRQRGLTPSYTEWHPKPEHADAAKVLVACARTASRESGRGTRSRHRSVRLDAQQSLHSHPIGATKPG